MKRRYNEVFLAALILELSQGIYNQLETAQTEADLKNASLEGYARAHLMGALWAGLGLLGVKLPITKADFASALQNQAEDSGVRLPKISSKPVLDRLAAQVAIAQQRLTEARDANAKKRAAGYAARWGVQQGVDDMAAGSTARNADGQEVELLKTWVRLASRAENRTWHDALEGVTIRYSQLFVIRSPNGTFRVQRPYDSSLPINEKIGCGHGIRVEPPRDVDVQLWNGKAAEDKPLPFANQLQTVLDKKQTRELLGIIDEIGLQEWLEKNPLSKITFSNDVRFNGHMVNGIYDYKTKETEINTKRAKGEFKQPFVYNTTYSISTTGANPRRAIQMTLVHELGHHIHNMLGEKYPKKWLETMSTNRFLGLTEMARQHNLEYFAESFSAWVFRRTELIQYDPQGYRIMTETLELLGISELKELEL